MLSCTMCSARYSVIDGVSVLIAEELSGQQEHQKGYFDAEYVEYGEYAPERWRLSFNERIFSAIGLPGRSREALTSTSAWVDQVQP